MQSFNTKSFEKEIIVEKGVLTRENYSAKAANFLRTHHFLIGEMAVQRRMMPRRLCLASILINHPAKPCIPLNKM